MPPDRPSYTPISQREIDLLGRGAVAMGERFTGNGASRKERRAKAAEDRRRARREARPAAHL